MIKSFKGKKPEISNSAFIAENSVIIGDVKIGDNASIWYGVTLRGDINRIVVGNGTNIQEGTVVHVDKCVPGKDGHGNTIIGNNVTIGHGAIIHACEIGDNSLIGMSATVLSGAKISENSLVAAGSLVREGQEFPPGAFIAGNPAIQKKCLSPEQINKLKESAENYSILAAEYLKAGN
ncbi:MAG: gamma carbonic anhydrase family protein [Candidatus Riflebacteria bacterium]|nr:gamma carbonic anhydrase family protein [Candidatus Riflebacteria bacterium]